MRKVKQGKKYLKIAASAACVASLLSLGADVLRHPLEPNAFVVRQSMPTPALRELLSRKDWVYLATVVFLTSATSWPTPGDWNNSNNSVECIGASGGGGGALLSGKSVPGGGGAGGGGYSKALNITISGTVTLNVTATGGTGGTGGGTGSDGGTGDDTWFNGASLAASSVGAKGGAGGHGGASDSLGGQGGQAASGIGSTKRDGGTGGAGSVPLATGGGGGGAAGPTGAGGTGANAAAGTGGTGGGADTGGSGAGAGGTGATAPNNVSVAGGAGTTFDATHGCGGGGGGGGGGAANGAAAAGGNYGGGGGGGGIDTQARNGGAGKGGLIVVTYSAAAGDNPPFSSRGRGAAQVSIIVATAQPDPWAPVYLGNPGGTQPYAKRQLPPQITAVQVDDPPPRTGGTAAILATIIALAQPALWPYQFEGGAQPYAPSRIAHTMAGADNPPFGNRGRIAQTAAIISQAQPDPWAYIYNGPAQGTQPYAPRKLAPSLTAVQVDEPPYTLGGPIAIKAETVAIAQPDPWTYLYNGLAFGAQPFAPSRMSPGIPGQSVDQPPFDRRQTIRAEIVATWQPDPWTYLYNGLALGAQPYAPSRLSPAIPGQSIDNPPFRQGGPAALISEFAQIAQPDPWTYVYLQPPGGSQPYGASKLSPAIPGQSIDQPPFAHPERSAAIAAIKTAWQPDPWVYDYLGPAGGLQPYAPRRLNPTVTAVQVDNPPTSLGGPFAIAASIVASAQPDPWQYVFTGLAHNQPYAGPRLPPAILFVRIDDPPFTEGGPNVLIQELAGIAQPDPWTYHYLGGVAGRQPYGPRQLPPTVTDVRVDNPPFSSLGRDPVTFSITAVWQPDPWTYSYLGPAGGTQPYAPRQLNAPGTRIDDPPFTHRERTAQHIALAASAAQPDPWTFNFPGGLEPFLPRKLSPGVPGQSVDQPPFSSRGRSAAIAAIIATTQPDPWAYIYLGPNGGLQPYAPRMTSAAIPGEDVDEPPYDRRTSALRAELAALWQPDPWVYAFLGGRAPFAPRTLSPGIPGQSINDPPPRARDLAVRTEVVALWQPDPWTYHYLGPAVGTQPYAPRKLNPSLIAVGVDQVPYRNVALLASVVAQAQPAAWPYTFIGAAQPYAPRTLSPGIPGQSVDQPPYDRRRAEQNAVAVAVNQPPTWNYTFIGGPQPYGPKPVPADIEAVPVPIPGSGKRYAPPTDYLPEPAYDAKPAKTFRPVWDKPQGQYEQPVKAPLPPALGVPLPPADIFATPVAGAPPPMPGAPPPFGLPDFNDLVPPDAAGLGRRMRDAQDATDAIAALRALGLFSDEG